jgi:hypothetical protein
MARTKAQVKLLPSDSEGKKFPWRGTAVGACQRMHQLTCNFQASSPPSANVPPRSDRMLTIDAILSAIAEMSPAQRQTLMQGYRRRWCLRCGREIQAKTPCPCSTPAETCDGGAIG